MYDVQGTPALPGSQAVPRSISFPIAEPIILDPTTLPSLPVIGKASLRLAGKAPGPTVPSFIRHIPLDLSLFDYVFSYICAMERLTKAEEQVMQALWKLGPSFVKDLLASMPDPKPAYTTVSTMVRILEQKGYVEHEAFGRSHRYAATVSKEAYAGKSAKRLLKDYFAGSPGQLMSHLLEREQLDLKELDEILLLIKKHKRK